MLIDTSCRPSNLSGAIGTFYWTGGDSKRMPALPVLLGMRYAFVYSIGSICFASIILALLQFIRCASSVWF